MSSGKNAFHAFSWNFKKFLAIPTQDGGLSIIGEDGVNYGAYLSRKSFEKMARRMGLEELSLGRVRLTFQYL